MEIKQKFIHYEAAPGEFTEWISPSMKGYLLKCCDCGLVHEVEFEVVRFVDGNRGELSTCIVIDDENYQVIFRVKRR